MLATDGSTELVRLFKALAADTRLRIIEALRGRCLCVNALAARLDMTHSAVSQHLRILKEAGLVRSEKRGYWVHYSLDEQRIGEWRERLGRFLDV
jgi:DNA-binding transcriptional ArsR family regulator